MKKILYGLVCAIVGVGSWIVSVILEPTIKTATTEGVKILVSKLIDSGGGSSTTTDGNDVDTDNDIDTDSDTNMDEDVIIDNGNDSSNEEDDGEDAIERFNLANKYTIQVGEFKYKSGADARLEEVKTIYPNAYIYEYTKQIYDKYETRYKVIIEKGESLEASEIYEKSIEYHKNLLNVISDEIDSKEKLAFPVIENKIFDNALDDIQQYAYDKNFEKAKNTITSFVELIDALSNDDYSGYKMYKTELKAVLDREENNDLKLHVIDIYNSL